MRYTILFHGENSDSISFMDEKGNTISANNALKSITDNTAKITCVTTFKSLDGDNPYKLIADYSYYLDTDGYFKIQ